MAFVNFVPDMTGYTTPSGEVSESSFYTSLYFGWKAFDRDNATAWWTATSVTSAWIQYLSSTAEICAQYTITGQLATYSPNSWTLEASNTGAFAGEEVVLDTRSGITWADSEKKTFTVTGNTTPYLYHRINVSSNNGGWNIRIAEIELMSELVAKCDMDVSVSSSASVITTGADMTASVSATAKPRPLNKAFATASATASALGQRKTYDRGFLIVQPLQIANTIQSFHFVHKIEQNPSPIVIQRVNI